MEILAKYVKKMLGEFYIGDHYQLKLELCPVLIHLTDLLLTFSYFIIHHLPIFTRYQNFPFSYTSPITLFAESV